MYPVCTWFLPSEGELDPLKAFGRTWALAVNLKKTEIMMFHKDLRCNTVRPGCQKKTGRALFTHKKR